MLVWLGGGVISDIGGGTNRLAFHALITDLLVIAERLVKTKSIRVHSNNFLLITYHTRILGP